MQTKKVAIYVRVSSLHQAIEGYSIGQQQDALTKYCEAMNWAIYNVYTDAGFSGGKIDRPAMQKLITDAKTGKFDTVLVYKLDRLSRSVQDTLFLVRDIFNENNIGFVSLQENIDTSTAMGNLFLTLLSAIAEFEREQIKERMQMGRYGRAKSGKSMMWNLTSYGYRYNKETQSMDVVPSEALIIKRIYKEYLSGKSISRIKDDLNAEGHVTKDKPWAYKRISHILTSIVYTGVTEFKGEIYEGLHEAIIDKETFELAQAEFKKRQQQTKQNKNNPRPFQAKYMLSGMIRCGYCGAPLKMRKGAVRKDGTRLMAYDCHNRWKRKHTYLTVYNNNEQCTQSGRYLKEDVEGYVINEIKKLQENPDELNKYLKQPEETKIDTKKIESQIKKIDKQIAKLNDLYLNDLITIEDLKSKADKFKSEKNILEAQLKKDENSILKLKAENVRKNLSVKDIDKMTYEEQRNLVKTLIKKVDVTKEDIKIIFDF